MEIIEGGERDEIYMRCPKRASRILVQMTFIPRLTKLFRESTPKKNKKS